MAGRARARDLGLKLGLMSPGPLNAITDVAGVRIGHCTVIEGDPPGGYGRGPARTGATAIWPGDHLERGGFPAGKHILNGTGEVTSLEEIHELGRMLTPIVLTNTMSVGIAYDAVCRYLIEHEPARMADGGVIIPVIGECNDGWLNDAHGMHLTREHVYEALRTASSGPVAEGCVGSGTGMICFGFKGGIGTSSRLLDPAQGGYTVGVLAMTNFGRRPWLTIGGYPVGQRYPMAPMRRQAVETPPEQDSGSCIVVIATDAPLTSRQLDRIAQRGGMGLARVGSYAGNGSGDIIVAFSTAYRLPEEDAARTYPVELVNDGAIDPLFGAAIEATEEAIVNSLCMAETTTGLLGRTIEAMPLEWIEELVALEGFERA
jgi:D-aminopeptidase